MSIVLSQADLDYSGMKKIGRVTICERPSQLGDRIWIDVDGFEFDDLPTCRMQSARVIAWARDLLSAQLEAHRVAPGGNIWSCIGLLQEELEEEMKGKAEDCTQTVRSIFEIAAPFISTCGNRTCFFSQMNKNDLLIPSWVDHEMQNWARWSLSAEYPGCPDWPGPRMARDLISRFYRAPDWGDDVRPLPPNEAHAQRVEQVVQKRMQPLERRIVDAEYLHPWDSGRWSYGRTGAALRLKRSLNSYEAILRNACLKVEQALGQ